MERNWDLVREIMLNVRELPPRQSLRCTDVEGYDAEVVAEHMYLLEQAGLAEVTMSRSLNGPASGRVNRLTWDGHEFIDLMQSDTQWSRIKESLKERGVDFSFDALKGMAQVLVQGLISG
ncbi:DUF2513 domain-containing protein [Marinobacterium stanieri]|uniref:DUF2513 domain-containing protein n=1 Tax=Marinobacterium stanieri TaxID=49186 RepID=UPI000255A168|nr:DUF2513 domain-containing protein [Marinobacterium stanieri]